MALWTLLVYIELTGRNPFREWISDLPDADQAKIDRRLQQMVGMEKWSEKWVSKYRGTAEIIELRITGNRVQYRPLGAYFGAKQIILLHGAIEKGDKIPKSDIDTAERRLAAARSDGRHVQFHQFDDDGDLEEDEPQSLS